MDARSPADPSRLGSPLLGSTLVGRRRRPATTRGADNLGSFSASVPDRRDGGRRRLSWSICRMPNRPSHLAYIQSMRIGIVASLLLSATINNASAVLQTDEVCSNTTFPFIYFDVNGNEVSGEQDPSGQCVFPSSACSSTEQGSGTSNCCKPARYTTGGNYMFSKYCDATEPD